MKKTIGRLLKNWRKSVFDRDDYTCQNCGDKSCKGNPVNLNAHHILKFIDFEDLRFEESNGITLCEICHKATYGKEEKLFKFMLYLVARSVQRYNLG